MSDLNNMDVQENMEQGMVVYEPNPQPEIQNKQQNIASKVSDASKIDDYFDKLDYHLKAATKYEDLTNITAVISRSLNNASENNNVQDLKNKIDDFSKRTLREANEFSTAKANAVLEARSNEGANDVAMNADSFEKAKSEYNSLINQVKTFMRENPSNPAVSQIISRTNGLLLSKAQKPLRDYEGKSEYKAAEGPARDNREKILDGLSKYIDSVNETSENEFVVKNDKSPDESTKDRLFVVAHNIKKELVKYGINIEELGDKNKIPNNLKDPAVKKDYLKSMDEYLLKIPEKNEALFSFIMKTMNTFNKTGNTIKVSELHLQDVKKVIQNKTDSWEHKQKYLKTVQAVIDSCTSTPVNVKDVDTFLGSEEDALKWLKMLGKGIYVRINEGKVKSIDDMLKLSNSLSKIGEKQVNQFLEQNKQNEQKNNEKEKKELRNQEKDLVNEIIEKGAETYKIIKDADPALMISSRQYKNMVSASDNFTKGVRLIRDSNELEDLSEEDIQRIIDLATEVNITSQEYTAYKVNALGTKTPNRTELSRLKAAANASGMAVSVLKDIHNITVEKTILDGPDKAIKAIEHRTFHGPVTERKLAEMLYLEIVKNDYKKTSDAAKVKTELDYNKMNAGINKIMVSPEFRRASNNIIDVQGAEAQKRIYTAYMGNAVDMHPQGEHPQRQQQHEHGQQLPNQDSQLKI